MKYCKFCGKQLADNETCNCNEALQEKNTMDSTQWTSTDYTDNQEELIQEELIQEEPIQDEPIQAKEDAKEKRQQTAETLKTAFHNIIPFVKSLIHAPGKTIKAAAENTDLPLSGILYASYTIALILCNVCMSSTMITSIGRKYLRINFLSDFLSINYGWIVFSALLSSIAVLVITVLFVLILAAIFHTSYAPRQIIAACGSIFVYPTALFLLAGIFGFISSYIAVILFVLGNIAYLVMFQFVVKTLFNKDDNSSYLVTSILIITILFLLTSVVSAKITGACVSKCIQTDSRAFSNSLEDYWDR